MMKWARSSVCHITGFVLAVAPCAQQQTAIASPPALFFGTLHQHNLVQASVHPHWPKDLTGEQQVEAPPFVRVLRSRPNEIVFAIRTSKLGPLHGSISIRRAGVTIDIPVRAVVLPRVAGQTRVLVAGAPWHGKSALDDKRFEPWRRVVASGKLQAHYVVAETDGRWFDTDVLQQVDVVVLCERCLRRIGNDDALVLQGFVCGGGRLVVCASSFYVGTIKQANELTEPFGLRMNESKLRQLGTIETGPGDIAEHALTAKVETLLFERPCPTTLIDDRAESLVKLDCFPEQAVIALARTASGGEVITIGVPLWWTWIAKSKDNERLWRNLLTRKPRPPR